MARLELADDRSEYTVNFTLSGEADAGEEFPLQLKFGPSAWQANAKSKDWKTKTPDPDYTHLFITSKKANEVRQSAVTVEEVLAGLATDDPPAQRRDPCTHRG